MLSHMNLAIYYRTIFSLAQHHKYSISDIENLLPYERDLYVEMLVQHIEEQNKRNNT